MRTCIKCGSSKETSEFYSGDTACKQCRKARVRANRKANASYYREYDRRRASRPDRVAARSAYAKSESGRLRAKEGRRAYLERHPERRAAHIALDNAVRDGRVKKLPCIVCDRIDSEGHHFDYSRPLDVIWLCPAHHSAFHKIERAIARALENAA